MLPVAGRHAPLGQNQFDVAQAQTAQVVQPSGVVLTSVSKR
jgi:hypothetical protein